MSNSGKSSFFKQSGWMVITTFAGGILMLLVQIVATKKMPEADFATLNALLSMMILLGVPAAALQSIFAHQAASAVTEEKKGELIATTQMVLKATTLLWIVASLIIVMCTGRLMKALNVPHPMALWLTAVVVLPTLVVPILKGLLQGHHHFGALGTLMISDGIGRLGCLVLIMLLIPLTTSGGVIAVCIGQFVTLGIGAYVTRDVWRMKTAHKMPWKKWLIRVVPLTLGMGTVIAMGRIDYLYVQKTFGQKGPTALYTAAMLCGFAMTQFISPIAQVMFPRLVRSAALAEKSNALLQTLAATGLFGAVAAIGCTLLPKLVLRMMFFPKPELSEAWPLMPWFMWGLLPLTLANVLIQNLLAKEKFKATPWLAMVPVAFVIILNLLTPVLSKMEPMTGFIHVVQTLGAFSLLLFLIAAWFTWEPMRKK